MYQAYARTCNLLIPMIVFICNCMRFWAHFIQVFLVNVYASGIVHADEHLHDSTAALE